MFKIMSNKYNLIHSFQFQQSPTSAPPPPPPPPGHGNYASLQHDTGQPGAQENNTYDIPQDGDAPNMYSSVGQPAQALVRCNVVNNSLWRKLTIHN